MNKLLLIFFLIFNYQLYAQETITKYLSGIAIEVRKGDGIYVNGILLHYLETF